jgi:hypothetical protein
MARSRELLISKREPGEEVRFPTKREVKASISIEESSSQPACGWGDACTDDGHCCGDHDCSECHPWICPDCGAEGMPGDGNIYGSHHLEDCDYYEE